MCGGAIAEIGNPREGPGVGEGGESGFVVHVNTFVTMVGEKILAFFHYYNHCPPKY